MQPAIPISIIISKQIEKDLTGRIICDIVCDKYHTGEYQLFTVSFENLDKIIGKKIIKANSNFIFTDNNMLVEFGYAGGDIRYYSKDKEIDIKTDKAPKTGGFIVKIIFDDSYLAIKLNGWTCRFNIRQLDSESKYPFITKYPLDITDENDFTLENFKAWLKKVEKTSILEACASVKGAFDVYIPFMNYILWISKVHPKTKVNMLSEDDISSIYKNTVEIINEYKSGKRICEHIDIYGNSIEANTDDFMNSQKYHKPCPRCGDLIDTVSGAGTKFYFCPKCQILKK